MSLWTLIGVYKIIVTYVSHVGGRKKARNAVALVEFSVGV